MFSDEKASGSVTGAKTEEKVGEGSILEAKWWISITVYKGFREMDRFLILGTTRSLFGVVISRAMFVLSCQCMVTEIIAYRI